MIVNNDRSFHFGAIIADSRRISSGKTNGKAAVDSEYQHCPPFRLSGVAVPERRFSGLAMSEVRATAASGGHQP
jgi:hypothetical protein